LNFKFQKKQGYNHSCILAVCKFPNTEYIVVGEQGEHCIEVEILSFCDIFSFFLSPKHSLFRIENFHMGAIKL
jgi:hypothetical protein